VNAEPATTEALRAARERLVRARDDVVAAKKAPRAAAP